MFRSGIEERRSRVLDETMSKSGSAELSWTSALEVLMRTKNLKSMLISWRKYFRAT